MLRVDKTRTCVMTCQCFICQERTSVEDGITLSSGASEGCEDRLIPKTLTKGLKLREPLAVLCHSPNFCNEEMEALRGKRLVVMPRKIVIESELEQNFPDPDPKCMPTAHAISHYQVWRGTEE